MKTMKTPTALMLATGSWISNASAGSAGTENTFYGINAGINTTSDNDGATLAT